MSRAPARAANVVRLVCARPRPQRESSPESGGGGGLMEIRDTRYAKTPDGVHDLVAADPPRKVLRTRVRLGRVGRRR